MEIKESTRNELHHIPAQSIFRTGGSVFHADIEHMCSWIGVPGNCTCRWGAGRALLIEQLLGYLNESLCSRISSTCGPQVNDGRRETGEKQSRRRNRNRNRNRTNPRRISNKCRENAPIKRCMKPRH